MWPFKSKYEKITHEEICDAIVQLEKELQNCERSMLEKDQEIDALMERGKNEKSRESKIFIAKKINFLRDEKQNDLNRAMYYMYNIKLMNRLKAAVDDNNFFKNNSGMPLNKLLADQKGLAKFLNSALNTKTKAENVLTEADELFTDVQEMYEPNEKIYGTQEADDELLSIFETDSRMGDDDEFAAIEEEVKAKQEGNKEN